jgi:hypothetical protein
MLRELETHREDAERALVATLSLEDGPLMTMNDHYYESTRRKWLYYYRDVRWRPSRYLIPETRPASPRSELFIDAEPPSPVYWAGQGPRAVEDPAESRALKALSELGYSGLSLTDLKRLHPPDQFDEELTVMADVRAYWQVAYKVILIYTVWSIFIWYSPSLSFPSASSTTFRSRSSTCSIKPSHRTCSSGCGRRSISEAQMSVNA